MRNLAKNQKADCWDILTVVALVFIVVLVVISWGATNAKSAKDSFITEARTQGFSIIEVTKIPPTLDYSVNQTELISKAKQLNLTEIYVYPDRLGWLVSILKGNESWTCKPK